MSKKQSPRPPQSLTKLRQLVQKSFEAADACIMESGRLIGEALETPPGNMAKIEAAIDKSHEAYRDAESALIQHDDLIHLLESSEKFMSDPKNREGIPELKKLSIMGKSLKTQCWTTLARQEGSLTQLKEVASKTASAKRPTV